MIKKEKFAVTGMTCSACSTRVEKCVSALEGMDTCEVNLLTGSMQASYDETVLSADDIVAAWKRRVMALLRCTPHQAAQIPGPFPPLRETPCRMPCRKRERK